MNKRTFARRIGVPFTVGAALVGGLAFAAFTPIGGFFADGHTASTVDLTTSNAHMEGVLWPGECNPVTFTLSNPNPRAVEITSAEQHAETGGGINAPEFIRQAVHSNIGPNALQGERIAANDSRTFTINNAVCLTSNATGNTPARIFDAQGLQDRDFTVVELFRTQIVPGSNPDAQF